ncbi:MAG: hypothetical protein KJP00_05385 [Bacteroidia bacterium]|nr:hypothetical protein [Bacteroidia bacterium]
MILSRVVISDALFKALSLPEYRKVQHAVELVHKIFEHPDFARRVLKFRWRTADGQSFQRFYYSNGRTNAEVLKCILHAVPSKEVREKSAITIQPFLVYGCQNKMEYRSLQESSDFVGVDMKSISKCDYTPIQIAASIVHEIAIKLGFPPKGKVLNECWSQFTVPVSMARIIRDISIVISEEDDNLLHWCMLLNLHSFDYRPCSFIYGTQRLEHLLGKNTSNLLTEKKINKGQEREGDSLMLTSLPN